MKAPKIRKVAPTPERGTVSKPPTPTSGVQRVPVDKDGPVRRTTLVMQRPTTAVTPQAPIAPTAPPVEDPIPTTSRMGAQPPAFVAPGPMRAEAPSQPMFRPPTASQPSFVPNVAPAAPAPVPVVVAPPAKQGSGYRTLAVVLGIALAFVSGVAATLAWNDTPVIVRRAPREAVIPSTGLKMVERDAKLEPASAEEPAPPAAQATAPPSPAPRPAQPVDLSGRDILGAGLRGE